MNNINSFKLRSLETTDFTIPDLLVYRTGTLGDRQTACGIYGANSATSTLRPASGLN